MPRPSRPRLSSGTFEVHSSKRSVMHQARKDADPSRSARPSKGAKPARVAKGVNTHGRRAPVVEAPIRKRGPKPVEKEELFPMRINKYLSRMGVSTRREADALIAKRAVLINGRVAQIGDKVIEVDVVELRKSARPSAYAYLAFNKPVGMDTHQEETGTPNILDSLPSDLKRLRLFPIGRLDKASHGLIILTNDGRITDRLLNPAHEHEKTYEVRTKQPLRSTFTDYISRGVNIEGYVTKPAYVKVLATDRFRITLTEGKTHQVRRMVVALFNEVQDLKRTSIMNIQLGQLKTGGHRPIEGKELQDFLHALGLA